MIRSTLLRLEPYKVCFLVAFLISNTMAVVMSQAGILPDIVPGISIPDVAFMRGGRILVPSEILAWYSKLEEFDAARRLYFWVTVIDLVAIIPSYTVWMGCEIVNLQGISGILCHIPIWTGLFDILETGTHFMAIQDRYLRHQHLEGYEYWTPPSSLLAAACMATPFKFIGLVVSLILVLYSRWKGRLDKQKMG
jgi:hypothetical protein